MKFRLNHILKSVSILLCLILCVLVYPVQAANVYVPNVLKIGLYYASTAKESIGVSCSRGYYAGWYDDREFIEDKIIEDTDILITRSSDEKIVITDLSGTVLYTESENKGIGIKPIYTNFWEERISIDGSDYRGSLNFIKDSDAIAVINMVDIDQYLYGVVSREMSDTWPIEALKAQAVCSRNYALKNLNKHEAYGFDLCANTHCQMYTGITREAESIYTAVDETQGMVLTYDGEVCECYYSSSMGDTTEDVQYVWGNEVPYLTSVDNSYEDTENIPNGTWTTEISAEEASTMMRNKGYDVGLVEKIEALEYSPNGRVTKLRVTGNTAIKTVEREQCRLLFGTVTKSQYFTVTGSAEAAAVQYICVTDGQNLIRQRVDRLELLASAGRSEFSGETLYVGDGKVQASYTDSDSENQASTSFIFSGQGWGHGVGMSQYGAKGMANAGYDYAEILTHYFSGTEVTLAY